MHVLLLHNCTLRKIIIVLEYLNKINLCRNFCPTFTNQIYKETTFLTSWHKRVLQPDECILRFQHRTFFSQCSKGFSFLGIKGNHFGDITNRFFLSFFLYLIFLPTFFFPLKSAILSPDNKGINCVSLCLLRPNPLQDNKKQSKVKKPKQRVLKTIET